MNWSITFVSYLIAGMIGASLGSFLGVVIDRSKNKKQKASIFLGRSRCSHCRRQLAWWENAPIFSYLYLLGRCRTCRFPIPYWLPLVEITGAVGGIWLIAETAKIGIIGGVGAAAVAAALVWIFFSDLIYGVVPDIAVVIGSIGAVLYQFFKNPWVSFSDQLSFLLSHVLAPALGASIFFLALVLATRRTGMGSGDVTLAFLVGLLLGWPLVITGLWLAFVIGAAAGLILVLLKRRRFGQTIPFGPFLIFSTLVVLLTRLNLLS